MTQSETLRIVSKAQYDQQTFLPIPPPTTPLATSSIRVQTKLHSLTSNNLAYCVAPDFLHFWSAFPIPPTTPTPYNDSQTYGISPAWGYCSVTDSTIPEIEPGRIIYGFVPISSHSNDMQLRQVEDMPDHWIETSSHRSKVMSLYQRYFLLPSDFSLDDPQPMTLFSSVVKPIWEAGSVLAKYVFSQDDPPIHPFGTPVSPWTEEQADLTGTCIICIAAGTKTSRSFLYQLATIDRGKKSKYSVIEVTGGSAGCERYLKDPPFQHTLLKYTQIAPDAFKGHKKFVLLNFGGRDNALARVAEAVASANPSTERIIVQIGGEARVATKEELMARREIVLGLKAVQMNTTAIKDEAMKRVGEKKYFEELNAAFSAMVEEQVGDFGGSVLGVRAVLSDGLKGEKGVEGCWERLTAGNVDGDEGLVVRL